jgi:FkbM family methyltransferase
MWKPWYVWRPWQLASRLCDGITASQGGYHPLQVAWGVTIVADPQKTIGRSIRTTGIYDLTVSEILARLVRPGDTDIDAGANVGYMTVLTAIAAGPSGRVVAWEPHPGLFDVLQRNVSSVCESYACAKVAIRNAALGETPGNVALIVPPGMETNDGLSYIGTAADGDTVIPVYSETLDEACAGESIAVLKLDVEGAELQVLRGASRLLSEGRIRHVVFEDHLGSGSPVIALLTSLGYEIFSLGWSMTRPRLTVVESRLAKSYEAPSYLATRAADDARRACHEFGWNALRRRYSLRHVGTRLERNVECA